MIALGILVFIVVGLLINLMWFIPEEQEPEPGPNRETVSQWSARKNKDRWMDT